jgi:hypothetical protein
MEAILKHFKVSGIATGNRFQKQFVVDKNWSFCVYGRRTEKGSGYVPNIKCRFLFKKILSVVSNMMMWQTRVD